jgi:Tol biopolymer transport system component
LGPDFQERVIYNDFHDGRLVSLIKNVCTGNVRVVDKPVYDVTSDGRVALSLNFERLHAVRPGYGYDRGLGCKQFERFPNNDGIWKVNLETGASELILTLDRISQDDGSVGEEVSAAHFNHIMVNPSGTRFMFLYRYKRRKTEYTRLYTTNMDGSDLICLTKNSSISHATWKNDEEILVWARHKSFGEHYYLFRDKSDHIKIVGEGILLEDGHPSYSPCGRYLLTDTYNNRARQRRLLIYDTKEEKVYCLGAFYSPFRYSGPIRCDLHPRWKRDGTQICIDSAFEGSRQVYIIDKPLLQDVMKDKGSFR